MKVLKVERLLIKLYEIKTFIVLNILSSRVYKVQCCTHCNSIFPFQYTLPLATSLAPMSWSYGKPWNTLLPPSGKNGNTRHATNTIFIRWILNVLNGASVWYLHWVHQCCLVISFFVTTQINQTLHSSFNQCRFIFGWNLHKSQQLKTFSDLSFEKKNKIEVIG